MAENEKKLKEPKIENVALGRRLRSVISGHPTDKVAGFANVSSNTLRRWLTGEVAADVHGVARIAQALDFSLTWLVSGIGEESGDWETNMPQLPRGHSRVPIFEGVIEAGSGTAVFDGDPINYIDFPTEWLKRLGDPAQMHAVTVGGDSMEPYLRSGDIIVVDYSQRTPREAVFAFNIDGWALVKRLRLKGDGVAELVSTNPNYPPMAVRLDKEGLIVGRVVWTGKAVI